MHKDGKTAFKVSKQKREEAGRKKKIENYNKWKQINDEMEKFN